MPEDVLTFVPDIPPLAADAVAESSGNSTPAAGEAAPAPTTMGADRRARHRRRYRYFDVRRSPGCPTPGGASSAGGQEPPGRPGRLALRPFPAADTDDMGPEVDRPAAGEGRDTRSPSCRRKTVKNGTTPTILTILPSSVYTSETYGQFGRVRTIPTMQFSTFVSLLPICFRIRCMSHCISCKEHLHR